MAEQAKKGAANKKADSLTAGLALGAGIIAAAAGGYFLYGPNGKTNRKKVRAWGIKARGEVLHELERMKDVSAETYNSTVDKVMTKYEKMKDVSGPEIEELKTELKRYWKKIAADLKARNGAPKKTASKKKAAKKKTASK